MRGASLPIYEKGGTRMSESSVGMCVRPTESLGSLAQILEAPPADLCNGTHEPLRRSVEIFLRAPVRRISAEEFLGAGKHLRSRKPARPGRLDIRGIYDTSLPDYECTVQEINADEGVFVLVCDVHVAFPGLFDLEEDGPHIIGRYPAGKGEGKSDRMGEWCVRLLPGSTEWAPLLRRLARGRARILLSGNGSIAKAIHREERIRRLFELEIERSPQQVITSARESVASLGRNVGFSSVKAAPMGRALRRLDASEVLVAAPGDDAFALLYTGSGTVGRLPVAKEYASLEASLWPILLEACGTQAETADAFIRLQISSSVLNFDAGLSADPRIQLVGGVMQEIRRAAWRAVRHCLKDAWLLHYRDLLYHELLVRVDGLPRAEESRVPQAMKLALILSLLLALGD
jgi:hypothetical protein